MEFSIGIVGQSIQRERLNIHTPRRLPKFIHVATPVIYLPNRQMLKHTDNWVMLYLLNDISSRQRYIAGIDEITKEMKFHVLKLVNRRVLMVPPGTEMDFLLKTRDAFQENYQLVTKFRKLLYRWMNRRFKVSNEDDLLTCEPPKKLITLRVNSEKSIYQFEATTILRDMIQRILAQGYMFPKYQMPRNPFTNCQLTLTQFYSVIKQLRVTGYTHWALEALAASQYNIEKFKERFGATVRKHIILSEFKHPSEDTLDIIHTFIDSQFDRNDESFPANMYAWALENCIDHRRITTWINLCKDYYLILYTDGNGKDYTKEIERINTSAAKLCAFESDELIQLYKKSGNTVDSAIDDALIHIEIVRDFMGITIG
jgi:hypothetical protein